MRIINTDILTGIAVAGRKIVILHGCNCFHTMGAGIAHHLRCRYPEVLRADIDQTQLGDRKKLGTYSVAVISPILHVVNCYTQFDWRWKGGPPVNRPAIRSCLRQINDNYGDDWEIRSCKIGCKRAGGKWEGDIERIFADELGDRVTIYDTNK